MQVLTREVFTVFCAREEEEEEEEEEEGKFIHFSIVYKLRNREPEKRRNY